MYSIPPIESVTRYRQDAVINRAKWTRNQVVPTRGEITEFTEKARRRLAFVACNTSVRFTTMVTLTYPAVYVSDGLRVKAHLRSFLQKLRRYLNRTYSYLWFLEFQKRGAPHFHILMDLVLPRTKDALKSFRLWIAQVWYNIVGSNDLKHLRAGTRTERIRKPDGAARYATKYAFKCKQKKVPDGYRNVGRFFGYSRDVKPVPIETIRVTEDDVRGTLEGWRYAPHPDRAVYRVLFNISDRFERSKSDDRRVQPRTRQHTRLLPVYPRSGP